MQNEAYMAVLFSPYRPAKSLRRAAMYALKVLHKKLIQACPFIHKKRLSVLIAAVHALLIGQRLSLTQLGRRLISKTLVKHNIKRIDRLLGNAHLYTERIALYRFVCHELLKGNLRPLIIVDWSDLTAERDYQMLRASLPVGGRALTLYEEVHSQKVVGNDKIHKQFLSNLKKVLPSCCCPILITDAGFRNPWFKVVRVFGWDYVGRVRNRDMLKAINTDTWKPCKHLYSKANRKPRYLGEYGVVRSNPINTYLYLVKPKPKGRHGRNLDGTRTTRACSEKIADREKEPWLITSSLTGNQSKASYIVKLYKTRMQIEEAFRDTKSVRVGFSLRESLSRNLKRLEILLLIGTLATYITWLVGTWAELKQWHYRFQSNSNKIRRVLSTFFIGCQVAKDNQLKFERREYESALSQIRLNALVQSHA